VIAATGLAAGVSVVFSAAAFSIQWLFGATAPVPFDTVFGAMVGVHTLIGIGEGVISALIVAAVLSSRPDLVFGASDLAQARLDQGSRVPLRAFVIGSVVVTMLVATVVSQFAVDDPDGLEAVAEDAGIIASGQEHGLSDSIFADYATAGINNESLSLAIAGAAGTIITLAVGYGLFRALRQRERVR
jgi:cobalt/nickel transport system permease protein